MVGDPRGAGKPLTPLQPMQPLKPLEPLTPLEPGGHREPEPSVTEMVDLPAPTTAPSYPAIPEANPYSIASFIVGLIWIAGVGSVLAIIFGHIARHQIKTSGEGGSGLAKTGLVFGYVGVVATGVLMWFAAMHNGFDVPIWSGGFR